MKWQGIFVDAATPFDHSGALYRTKVQHNIEKWCRTSVSGLVLGGQAGEGALLTSEERVALWQLAAQDFPADRVRIAGIDTAGVRAGAMLAARAADLGYHAILAETPRYDPVLCAKPETQVLYFRCLADQSPIPVLIANRPAVSGIDLDAATLILLSQHPNIAGVLDCTGDAGRIPLVAGMARSGFQILCGDEQRVWECLRGGASGAILALASAAPYVAIALWEAFRTREQEAGLDWQARLAHPAELVTTKYSVPGLKVAMDGNGYYGGPPRLPGSVPSPEVRDEIIAVFHDLRG